MKIGFITDIHARHSTPSCRKDVDYIASWRNELNEALTSLSNCDIILLGGDIFNKPEAKCIVTNEIIKIFKKFDDKLYTVVGNHDIFGYSEKGLNGTSLELLLSTGIVNLLNEIKLNGITIRGVHAYDNSPNFKKDPDAKATIVVAHKMISPSGSFNGIKISDIDSSDNANIVLSGDIHIPHEVKIGDRIYLNPGAMARQSIEDRNRTPRILEIEINDTGIKYNYIPVKCAAGKEMFKEEEYLNKKASKESLIDFATRYSKDIREIRASAIDIKEQLRSYLDTTATEKEVREVVERYFKNNEKE